MADEPDYDPVACPAKGCSYRDAPRSVAAHVSGTHDERHDWDRLPQDGARAFVLAEKRRQLEARGEPVPGDGASTADAESAADATAAATAEADEAAVTALDTTFADDAVAVLSLLDRYGTADVAELNVGQSVNLYVLLSNLRATADQARQQVRDALLDEVPDGWSRATELGEVERRSSTRRRLRDEETVWQALLQAGVEPTDVMSPSLDEGKVEDAVEAGRVDEESVFETEEWAQVRRVDVDEDRRDQLLATLDPSLRRLLEDV